MPLSSILTLVNPVPLWVMVAACAFTSVGLNDMVTIWDRVPSVSGDRVVLSGLVMVKVAASAPALVRVTSPDRLAPVMA